MAICGKCGAEMPEGTVFCPACGAAVGDAPQPQIPDPQQFNQQQPPYQQPPYPAYPQAPARFTPPGYDAADVENNRVLCVFAYLFNILGVILLLVAQPQSKFCRFHANQALVLGLFAILCGLVTIVPILGWIAGGIGAIFAVVCEIIGIVNAVKGRAEPLPVIGKYDILH